MIKKCKSFVLLLAVLLLSGCTVDYNIKIKDDLTITDQVYGVINEEIEGTAVDVTDQTLNSIRYHIVPINELNYEYDVKKAGNEVLFQGSNKSIDDYINQYQRVYQQWFRSLTKSEQNGIVTIKADNFYPYNEQDPDKVIIHNLNINLQPAFEVVSHNADAIDEKTNTYTWRIDEETKEKSILLAFDTSKKINIEPEADKGKKTNNMAIVGIVILGLIILLYLVNMIKKQGVK